MSHSKRVLIISNIFPPRNSIASLRSGCFAKYLPEYGWEPVIVCQKWHPANCSYDKAIIKNFPKGLPVYEVDCDEQTRSTFINKMFRRCHGLFNPHQHPREWWMNSQLVVREALHHWKVDIIWATSPPHGNFAIADHFSRQFGIPWVADFRDTSAQNSIISRRKKFLHLLREKSIIRSASSIVTVSDGLAEILRNRHRRHVDIIHNGFDPDDWPLNRENYFRIPTFSLLYTGTLIRERNPKPLLDAVATLVTSDRINKHDISVDFYGAIVDTPIDVSSELDPFVIFNDRVSRSVSLELQKTSCILLLFSHPEEKGVLTGKLFEYLISGRPILAIPKDNAISKMLETTKAGVSLSGHDEIVNQLLRWYNEWKATGIVRCHSSLREIQKYSRKEQTGKLAYVLNSILENKPS